MPTISLTETQALAELADLMYTFLPGSGAIYTWREAAVEHGVQSCPTQTSASTLTSFQWHWSLLTTYGLRA